jgi:cobalt/nickel transport system permease protein
VSQSGLETGGGLLAKATLSVLAATVLAATTEPRELLRGLERLRLPSVLVQILAFMIRYADVVGGELQRMRVARESRGFSGGRRGAMRTLGSAAGSLFIRSYERGERVHLAMLSRGYDGRLSLGPVAAAPAKAWLTALSLPAVAAAVLATGTVLG